MMPAISVPNVLRQAPVRVAMSTIASTGSSVARTSASPMTRRPSASVLMISTVLPPRMTMMSPMRRADPDGMLSVHIRKPVTWAVQPSSFRTLMAARMLDAPVMSFFIVACTSSPGLMARPPASYMMPLPTSASLPVGSPSGR